MIYILKRFPDGCLTLTLSAERREGKVFSPSTFRGGINGGITHPGKPVFNEAVKRPRVRTIIYPVDTGSLQLSELSPKRLMVPNRMNDSPN
jgi:hypothetical protein